MDLMTFSIVGNVKNQSFGNNAHIDIKGQMIFSALINTQSNKVFMRGYHIPTGGWQQFFGQSLPNITLDEANDRVLVTNCEIGGHIGFLTAVYDDSTKTVKLVACETNTELGRANEARTLHTFTVATMPVNMAGCCAY